MLECPEYQVMPNAVKERADVHFQCPAVLPAPGGTSLQCVMRRFPWTIPVRVVMENRFQPCLHLSFHCPLSNAIGHGRYAQDAFFPIVLRDPLLPHRRREVRTRTETVPDSVEITVTMAIKVRECLAITARRPPVLSDVVIRRPHQRFWDLEWFPCRHRVILCRVVRYVHGCDACPFAPGSLQALHHYYEQVRPYTLDTCQSVGSHVPKEGLT